MKCKNIECENETLNKRVYCSLSCRNIYVNKYLRSYDKCKNTVLNKKQDLINIYLLNPKLCKLCNNIISYDKKDNLFCSKECNNKNSSTNNSSKNLTDNEKLLRNEKIKNSLIEYNKNIGNITHDTYKNCILCNKQFLSEYKKMYCSKKCLKISKIKPDIDIFKLYKQLTTFKFALNKYPNEFEFDFDLIRQYGWYKAKNHGDNLNGVSRDHNISVTYGFSNKINPLILAHPANCQLLCHNVNVSKHMKCDININDLLTNIDLWNNKYGNYYNNNLDTYINLDNINSLIKIMGFQ